MSTVAITGFVIDDKEVSQMYIGQRPPYLIPAGNTYKLQLGRSGTEEEALSLVLHAAVFADGGWAGPPNVAARIAALQVGAETQCKQIGDLLERFRSDPQTGGNAMLWRIRSELDRLPEEPPAQALHRVLDRFPDLQKDAVDNVLEELKSGLHVIKQVCGFGLREFERNVIGTCPAPSLSEWWNEFSSRTPRAFCAMRA